MGYSNGFAAENYAFSDDDDSYQSMGAYDYAYEEEGQEDHDFDRYFNGNNDMEEQNGDLEPEIFWTMNVFAILSGVVLCFFISCYCLRKKQGKYEFIKETDFEESASEYPQCDNQNNGDNKYGFHPINVAMQPRVSDDDEDEQDGANEDEQEPLQQPNIPCDDEYASEISANQNI